MAIGEYGNIRFQEGKGGVWVLAPATATPTV